MPLSFPYDDPLSLAMIPPPRSQGNLYGAAGMSPTGPAPSQGTQGPGVSLSDVAAAVQSGRGFSSYGGLVGQALGLGPSNVGSPLGMGYGLASSVMGLDEGPIGQAMNNAMGFGVPGAVLGGPLGLAVGSGLGAAAGLAGVNEGMVSTATNALGLAALGFALGGPTGGLIGAAIGGGMGIAGGPEGVSTGSVNASDAGPDADTAGTATA